MANKQYIYIDDSGDPGPAHKLGASRFLILASIGPHSDQTTRKISVAVEQLRHNIRQKSSSEFKFHHTRPATRRALLKIASSSGTSLRAVVLDKTHFTEPPYIKNPDLLLNYAILQLLRASFLTSPTDIIIDGIKGRQYAQKATTYFRKNLPRGVVRSVTFRDSKKDNLLQLADIVVGLVADVYEDSHQMHKNQLERLPIELLFL